MAVQIKQSIDLKHDFADITPLGPFVLVEVVKRQETMSEGGILIPVSGQENSPYLQVKALGPDVDSTSLTIGDVIEPNGEAGRVTYFHGRNMEQLGLIDIKHVAAVFKKVSSNSNNYW